MSRILMVLTAVLVVAAPVAAQDWKAKLQEDLVRVSGGKMIYEEFGILKIAVPGYEAGQWQVKVYAEAPAAGVISRDNFVGFTAMTVTTVLLSGFAEAYQVPASQFIQGYDFTELDAPIGNPDLELSLFVTAEGMQLEWVDTASGQRTRQTTTWAEIYEK